MWFFPKNAENPFLQYNKTSHIYSSKLRTLGDFTKTIINVRIPLRIKNQRKRRFKMVDTIRHSSRLADSSSFLKMLFITTHNDLCDFFCLECATRKKDYRCLYPIPSLYLIQSLQICSNFYILHGSYLLIIINY